MEREASLKTLHHSLFYFLVSLHSSSRSIMTRSSAAMLGNTHQAMDLHMVFHSHSCRYSQKPDSTFSLIEVLVNFKLHNHRYFYRDTISRKTTTQSYSRDRLFLSEINPVFYGLRDMVLQILFLLLLLILSLLFSRLAVKTYGASVKVSFNTKLAYPNTTLITLCFWIMLIKKVQI